MEKVIKILTEEGPLTGKELAENSGLDEFELWRYCYTCDEIITKTIGEKYLRLDEEIEGYARLSPSIKREFYGYTIVGLEQDLDQINLKAKLLLREIKDISRRKFLLAKDIVNRIVQAYDDAELLKTKTCFIIAGDVAYDMAHLDLRPESSTGELVRGSDLDIVVATNGLPPQVENWLDATIYEEKNHLLKNPSYKEEIDYVIKDIDVIQSQLRFDNFHNMVASKILYEGKFLYGNHDIFLEIGKMLRTANISEKLRLLEEQARKDRERSIAHLLKVGALTTEHDRKLFYTKEEKEEFI